MEIPSLNEEEEEERMKNTTTIAANKVATTPANRNRNRNTTTTTIIRGELSRLAKKIGFFNLDLKIEQFHFVSMRFGRKHFWIQRDFFLLVDMPSNP